MHDHDSHSNPPSAHRHCDVAVIGASAAGLAGALQIARQRRSAIVVDSGEPRNAAASHMHSYLGHEGLPPSELLAIGREEVRSFGGEVLSGRVVDVTFLSEEDYSGHGRGSRSDDDHGSGDHGGGFRFVVHLTGGTKLFARRVLAATGVSDVLPGIEGLASHWGTDVITCPFCHGYEVRDRKIVQIVTHPMGLHPAVLFAHLSEQLTVVLHEGVTPDDPGLTALRSAGVNVIDSRVRRVAADTNGRLGSLELDDGTVVDADAVVVTTRAEPRIEAFAGVGLKASPHPSGLAQYVVTTPTGETEVAGLFAAGNIVEPSLQMAPSAAAGSQAGAIISFSLAEEDLNQASHPSANEADWDHRYSAEQMWSGNPNGSLVAEVGTMEPGTVLDVGAGEGGDAIWLAERGWKVTANDISRRALDRIGAVAADRGLDIDLIRADVNAVDPFGSRTFDLVTAQYASIPRTADARGLQNILGAVAPGGTLVVVSHDIGPMRRLINPNESSRAFDPEAYVTVDDFVAELASAPEWEIVTHETRPRPSGAVSTHHVDDVILRALRKAP